MVRSPGFDLTPQKLWRRWRLVFVVLGIIWGPGVEGSPRFETVIVHIASGDSFSIRRDGVPVRCQLGFADAPEIDQPYGPAAKKALGILVFNRRVLVEILDKKAMLVRLEIEGRQVDELLLASGLAWLAPQYAGNSRLALLQSASRSARRGLWRDVVNIAPWRWRAGLRSPPG